MNRDVMKALSLIGIIVVLFIVVESGALTSTLPSSTSETLVDQPSSQSPDNEVARRDLVLQVCSGCHGLVDLSGNEIVAGRGDIPGFQLFQGVSMVVTPRDWAATVDRMRVANSCEMNDLEEATIIKWLNEFYG